MRDVEKIQIEYDYTKQKRGHRPHRSGSGPHGDKRTKRCRTRSAQNQLEIKRQLD